MPEKTEADPNERKHKVQAEEVSIRQLWASPRQAKADDIRLVFLASCGEQRRENVDVEADVEQVVDGNADGDHQRLSHLFEACASATGRRLR